ncbi:MAG TPA: HAD family hydrolase [Longimicrobium sp.]|nr:HAD family hydrolase [Longimicrobium sp.]
MSDFVPAALLFDLDGTLIDTWTLYIESYTRALTPFLGRAPTREDFEAHPPLSEGRFLREWLGEEEGGACHAELVRVYEELHPTHAEGFYDGVPEMLAALRAAGIPLGIVTGKGRRAWEVTEGAFALGDFAVVLTDDDVDAPKPDPRGLLAAAARLGVEPARLAYVGDSVADLRAGRAAGMRVGAVLWPKTGEGERERFVKEIEPLAPDWLFERPADLTRTFARWC